MSLTTSYWGEPFWKTLYAVAYTYPNNPSDAYRRYTNTLYEIMAQLLPSEECREHYCKFLDQHPIHNSTGNRDSLLQWVNSLENTINKLLQMQPVLLATRIAELDRHNPTMSARPGKTVPTARTSAAPRYGRHSGAVSYGIRKPPQQPQQTVEPVQTVAGGLGPLPTVNTTPIVHQSQPVMEDPPIDRRRPKGTVSYGMRKSTAKQSRSRCTGGSR